MKISGKSVAPDRGHFKPAGQDPRRGKGGRRKGAGRPTKEEADFKQRLKQAVEAELDRRAKALARRYVARALGPKGDKVLMHAIDRAVPAAKQEMDHSGEVIFYHTNLPVEE